LDVKVANQGPFNKETGYFDLPKQFIKIVATEDYGYVVDGEEGMWVLDFDSPKNPYPAVSYATPGKANDIKVDNEYAYIADGESGLQIINIQNPFNPVKAGSYDDIGNAISVAYEGDYVYVGNTDDQLHIINVSNLENIEAANPIPLKGEPIDVEVFRGYAYIAQANLGLEVLNVIDPEDPSSILISGQVVLSDTLDLEILGRSEHLFVADGKNGLKVFDIDRPASPEKVEPYPLQSVIGAARSVTIEGEYAFLAVENEAIYQRQRAALLERVKRARAFYADWEGRFEREQRD